MQHGTIHTEHRTLLESKALQGYTHFRLDKHRWDALEVLSFKLVRALTGLPTFTILINALRRAFICYSASRYRNRTGK